MEAQISVEAERQLLNVHRGIHQALDHLVNAKDFETAERLLRQVDQRLVSLLNGALVVSRAHLPRPLTAR
jgi:ATP/maltotriose-dependent transcriptional regulator MalT